MSRDYFWGLVGFKRRKGGGRKEEGAPDLPPCLCLHLCPSLPVHPNTRWTTQYTASLSLPHCASQYCNSISIPVNPNSSWTTQGCTWVLMQCIVIEGQSIAHTGPPSLSLHLYPSALCIPIAVGPHSTLHQYPRLHLGADAVYRYWGRSSVLPPSLSLHLSALFCASQWMRINRSASHY